ncbi:MAG: HEAT repeat domain-containing protein [Planctomycetota bacterium]
MLRDSARYEVARTPKSNKGSKLLTAIFAILLIGVPGAGYYLYRDTPGLVRHVRARDGLAVASIQLLALKGAPLDSQELLLEALVDANMSPRFREGAAKCLGKLKLEDALINRTLGQSSAEDPSPLVRAAALRAIGDNGYATMARDPLRRAFREEQDEDVKCAAAYAVGKLGLRDMIPEVMTLLSSTRNHVRSAGVEALETFTNPGETYGQDRKAWLEWYEKNG